MKSDELLDSIRENFNGRPGQPLVFGVCATLAKRSGHEPWIFRVGTLALALFWTMPAVGAYIALGLLLPETQDRTRGVFKGLFIALEEWVEKGMETFQDLFGSKGRGNTPS
jgi:phage shock protein PspC (stress-responsive transcriptional regulator)